MKKREYAIWGTKNGVEDIVRINGQETQHDITVARNIKNILDERKQFESTRIQTLNMNNFDLKTEFSRGIKRKK